MAEQIKALEQFLVKEQATFGTKETSLAAADKAEVMVGSSFGYETTAYKIHRVGAGFSQNASVPGLAEGTVTLIYPLCTTGVADGTGQWSIPILACGFTKTEATDIYTFAPSSNMANWKHNTVWGHLGDTGTATSVIYKIYNIMYNGKITLDFKGDDSYPKIEYTGKGIWDRAPAAGTQATITKANETISNLHNCTVNFFGESGYDLQLLEVDFGCVVKVTANPAATDNTGLGRAVITDQKIGFHAIVIRKHSTIAETGWAAGTLGTLSVLWGAAPRKFTIASGASKAQMEQVNLAEQDGISTYDINGIFVDNSFSIVVDTTV